MKTTPVAHGMFCWHELVTARTADAANFYKELFGGEVQSFPIPTGQYSVLHVEGAAVAGFQPANPQTQTDAPSQWLAYVAVDDVDAVCARAVAAGGTVTLAPHDMSMGRAAIIRDPQGARVALFRSNPGATDGTNPVGPGAVCWMELATNDVAASSAFYVATFGWKVAVQKLPFGDVHVARAGDAAVCSIFPRDAKDAIAYNRWYPYFQVASIDQTSKRVRALGGVEAAPIMDLPSVGRWFPAADPVGAEVAFMELDAGAKG